VAGSYENGNEFLSSTKDENLLLEERLSVFQERLYSAIFDIEMIYYAYSGQ
jgi:hypothetical protein